MRSALLDISARNPGAAALGDIFLPVDWADMRRVAAEIGAPDPELLAVGIDPFPEGFRRSPALRAIVAVDADDVRGEPTAIAAARTAGVIRPVGGRLQAGCDRLTVTAAERAGEAGLQSGVLGGVQHLKQF